MPGSGITVATVEVPCCRRRRQRICRTGLAVVAVEAPCCRRRWQEVCQELVSLSPLLKLHVVVVVGIIFTKNWYRSRHC